jgi:hypothetical protein
MERGDLETSRGMGQRKTKRKRKIKNGATFAVCADGTLEYDVNIIEMHYSVVTLLGRMLEQNNKETAYIARCAFSTEIYTRGCHWIPRLLA